MRNFVDVDLWGEALSLEVTCTKHFHHLSFSENLKSFHQNQSTGMVDQNIQSKSSYIIRPKSSRPWRQVKPSSSFFSFGVHFYFSAGTHKSQSMLLHMAFKATHSKDESLPQFMKSPQLIFFHN